MVAADPSEEAFDYPSSRLPGEADLVGLSLLDLGGDGGDCSHPLVLKDTESFILLFSRNVAAIAKPGSQITFAPTAYPFGRSAKKALRSLYVMREGRRSAVATYHPRQSGGGRESVGYRSPACWADEAEAPSSSAELGGPEVPQ